MIFYYKLDNLNRFTYISGPDNFDESAIEGWDISEEEYNKIVNGFYGIENNKIVPKEKTNEEMLGEQNHIKKEHRIPDLKKLLQDSDYKMMKCYEAFMSEDEMPYDFESLKAQRKAWRDEINEIEEELGSPGSSSSE
jgi:hypothetical protein